MSRLCLSVHIFWQTFPEPDRMWWSIRAIVAKAWYGGSMLWIWEGGGVVKRQWGLARCLMHALAEEASRLKCYKARVLQGGRLSEWHGSRISKVVCLKRELNWLLSPLHMNTIQSGHQSSMKLVWVYDTLSLRHQSPVSLGDPDDSAQVILDCKEHNVALYEKQGVSGLVSNGRNKHGGFLKLGPPKSSTP